MRLLLITHLFQLVNMSVLLVTHLLELVDIYVLLIVQLLEAFVGLPLSSQLGT